MSDIVEAVETYDGLWGTFRRQVVQASDCPLSPMERTLAVLADCRVRIATLTADHMIDPLHKFQADLVSAAREAVHTGSIYTFGVRPAYPATGYGYLKLGARLLTTHNLHFYLNLMRRIRAAIASDTLPELIASLADG